MSEEYLNRIPVSDIDIEDAVFLESYNKKITKNEITEAINILNEVSFDKGIRASILNKIRTSILELEMAILNLTADEDTYYSLTVPTEEQMNGKKFWICPKQ